jgi:hypothetical protein
MEFTQSPETVRCGAGAGHARALVAVLMAMGVVLQQWRPRKDERGRKTWEGGCKSNEGTCKDRRKCGIKGQPKVTYVSTSDVNLLC